MRLWRPSAAPPVVAALVAVLVATGCRSNQPENGPTGDPSPSPQAGTNSPSNAIPWTPPPVPELPPVTGEDFQTIVDGLEQRIHWALVTRDQGLLTEAVDRQCECWEANAAVITRYRSDDLHLEADPPQVIAVEISERPDPAIAAVEVVLLTPRQRVIDTEGEVVGDTEHTFEIQLHWLLGRREDGTWRIVQQELYSREAAGTSEAMENVG